MALYKSTYENARIKYSAIEEEIKELKNEYYDLTNESFTTSTIASDSKLVSLAYNIERL
jgi:hypothetical protein